MAGTVQKRIADLRLDGENPRHDPVSGEREAIEALLAKEGPKITALANHIAANGLSPIDPLLVVEERAGVPVVVEGNRRLAVLKLLADPSLTARATYARSFAKLKKGLHTPISEVSCYVMATRDEAKPWQALRHGGEQEGRGVIRWDSEASARFFGIGTTGKHVGDAITLMDELRRVYPKNATLLTNLDTVRGKRLSTLGRIFGDPDVRDRFGLTLQPKVVSHYSSTDLEAAFARIATDIASGTVTVSAVFKKTDRARYLTDIVAALPDPSRRQSRAAALVPVVKPRPSPGQPMTPPTSPAPVQATHSGAPTASASVPVRPAPQRLFEGVVLTKLGSRIPLLLNELQRLDVGNYPNACATLMRAVIELSVTEVCAANNWKEKNESFRDMVKKCVYELDRNQKDDRFEPVRIGLSDGTSLFAVATLHAWVHNKYFHPTAADLRAIAANYSAFLSGLDGLVP